MDLALTRLLSPLSLSVLLSGLLLAAAPVQAGGELHRFPQEGAVSAADASRHEGLKELLRQAHQLQKEQQKAEQQAPRQAQEGARQKPADAGRRDGASPLAKAVEAELAAAQDAVKPEDEEEAQKPGDTAEDEAEEAEPKKQGTRPGCMYRGTKLIWEKVPGTCAK